MHCQQDRVQLPQDDRGHLDPDRGRLPPSARRARRGTGRDSRVYPRLLPLPRQRPHPIHTDQHEHQVERTRFSGKQAKNSTSISLTKNNSCQIHTFCLNYLVRENEVFARSPLFVNP
jgi:hypothetical protein